MPQAGTKENVIPDEAIIKLNVRTFDKGVRQRVLAAITRIVNAEAAASGAPKPPEITPLDSYALVVNDADANQKVGDAFRQYFPEGRVEKALPISASEDFGCFGVQWKVPSVFWLSAAPMRISTRRQRPRAGSTICRPTTTRGSRRSSSQPCAPASKPWSSPRAPGWWRSSGSADPGDSVALNLVKK